MVGEALRLLRVFHDCKTTMLAEALGLSPSYISEIENNRKNPSLDTIKKYADYFETSISAIMFFAEDLEKDKDSNFKTAARAKLIKFMQFIENATT